jgi:hypothetical protein
MYPAHDPQADLERWEDEGGKINAACCHEAVEAAGIPVKVRPQLRLVRSNVIRPAPDG